ncbi:MAG: hypothetical protein M0R74_12485 [Dehalococcoidia bacterium]|nr:hypothetical protein [Dehalococcoidia bacterium]
MLTAHEAAKDLESPAGVDAPGYAGTITHMTARRKEMLERMKQELKASQPNNPEEASQPDARNIEAYAQERRMLRAMANRDRAA